ncbi:hypothetical protein BS47DRAFT_1402582 [Hydnum rufescens UP504]|uniref:Uncharacterized protein n=1 Tax=Hydnum rufescens UP504 TaxID=1448309 RepID=A0A9P6DM75_9AGAM|nr:hypothetical protein BS47DRAFT_1402582 [Hydnum rufescens UP504]
MANHSAMTWDKDQRLVKAEYGTNSSAYPSSQDFTRLFDSAPSRPGMQVLYLQIAWALVYTNSMCDFVFLGHPDCSATTSPDVTSMSLYDNEPSGLQESWAAYSWKDTSVPFDPHDYTQYPTTYSRKYPHLPYIKRRPDPQFCLSRDDPRIIPKDAGFHLDISYVHDLVEFSQKTFDSFVIYRPSKSPFSMIMVISLLLDKQSTIFCRYSYEVTACRTLYFHQTLRKVLGKRQFIYGIDDSMVGTVLEHPFLQTPWVQELMADGVPIFCIKDDVWRQLDSLPNGYQLGNHEIEEQNVLKSFEGLAHVLTVRDVVFRIINDGMDDHINLLRSLEQVFGNCIMDNAPETGQSYLQQLSNSLPLACDNSKRTPPSLEHPLMTDLTRTDQ